MSKSPIRVAIVDDEASVRTALARLLSASSFEPKTYGSAREFIDSIRTDIPECLVVDVHMPDFTGLDLQRYLNRINKKIPTVVITAFDDAGREGAQHSVGRKGIPHQAAARPNAHRGDPERNREGIAGCVACAGGGSEEKETLAIRATGRSCTI